MGIEIGSLLIPYYGLCIVIGVIVAAIVGYIQVKVNQLDINDFSILAGMVALGGIVGAKILYLIVSKDSIDWGKITDLKSLNNIMSGGFVFYGGLLCGILMLIICKRKLHISIEKYVECCMPCIPIVHGFGRLGCSLVGCCYGMPYDGKISIMYHNSLIAPNDISLFPIQAIEAIGNFVIAIVLLLYIYCKKKIKISTIYIYLLLYASLRFYLEFYRYDKERGFVGIFSTSQWISIGLFVLVVGRLGIRSLKGNLNKKRENIPPRF